jgi:hypothetical protein
MDILVMKLMKMEGGQYRKGWEIDIIDVPLKKMD